MSILHIKSWFWVAIAGFLLIGISCRKDKEITTQTIVYSTDPVIAVQCSITGVVTDGNGNPINNVSVFLDAIHVQTDDNGFFYLKDVYANKNGASVRFEKSGYHSTSKLVYPSHNRVEFIQVSLLKSDETGVVSMSKGGTASLSNGVEIFFPENAFLNQSSSGSDDVSVHMTYIDPTEEGIYQKMPGSLIGINQERRILGMETFGMIGVELFDENGNVLELNPEKRATISMPIPDELRGVAPESVPLWHFDQKSAYWVQEGSVNIDGDKYIGQVSHFSFWNIDVEMELIDFAAHLVNQQGMDLPQLEMRIKTTSPTIQTGYGYSNNKGWVKGKIPANMDLVMEIYSKCNELIHSENIGPFNDNMTDEEYVIEVGDQSTLQGFLVGCFDVPVENGYVKVTNQGGDYFMTIDKGEFRGQFPFCSMRELTLIGYDLNTGFQSQRETFAVEPVIDAETIEACDQIAYVFEISFPQGNYVIENCTGQLVADSSGNMEPNVYVRAEDNTGEITLEIDSDTEGVFPVRNFRLSLPNNPNEVFFNHNLTCTLERWEAAPSIALGSIDGRVITSQGDTVSITGSFTALRD